MDDLRIIEPGNNEPQRLGLLVVDERETGDPGVRGGLVNERDNGDPGVRGGLVNERDNGDPEVRGGLVDERETRDPEVRGGLVHDRDNNQPTIDQRITTREPLWAKAALIVAGAWSLVQLALGLIWLTAPNALSGSVFDNPFDPTVDVGGDQTSLLTAAGAHTSAVLLVALGALGVIVVSVMAFGGAPRPAGRSRWRVAITTLAGLLAAALALLLPDYRLIATIGYTPVIAVEQLIGATPRVTLAELYNQTTVAMILMSLAGVAFAAAAIAFGRRVRGACLQCGRGHSVGRWTSRAAAARWGRWAVIVAIVIPVGYATTRWAWALGVPLGVSRELLTEIGSYVWMGAALGAMAIGGAVLTLGLVQHWGEVFPRWIPVLRGRRVPISLAVAPALLVSVVVISAGLMFGRMALTGRLDNNFPGNATDIFAWLPEMFWPLWGVALAVAAIGYWLRRRGECRCCGRGDDARQGRPLSDKP